MAAITKDRVCLFGHVLLVISLLTSCTTSRLLSVHSLADSDAKAHRHKRVAIAGYVTVDGKYHRFSGYMEVYGDSLRFVMPPSNPQGFERSRPGRLESAHRDSVRSVNAIVTNYPMTLAVALGFAGVVALLIVGSAFSLSGHP